MNLQSLQIFHKNINNDFQFQAEIFNKAIWGDMGEDSAQITITIKDDTLWHLHFIRTQSGDPSPFDDFVCNVIDEYEKDLDDNSLYDVLTMHQLLIDFEKKVQSIAL